MYLTDVVYILACLSWAAITQSVENGHGHSIGCIFYQDARYDRGNAILPNKANTSMSDRWSFPSDKQPNFVCAQYVFRYRPVPVNGIADRTKRVYIRRLGDSYSISDEPPKIFGVDNIIAYVPKYFFSEKQVLRGCATCKPCPAQDRTAPFTRSRYVSIQNHK